MILIKTPEQIDGIRRACQLATKTLRHLEPLLLPGISTKQIDIWAMDFIQAHEARSASLGYPGKAGPFPGWICTSINDAICHGVPNDSRLKEGDIIGLDVAVILDGYYGDTCRTYAIGQPTNKIKQFLVDAEECLIIGIRNVHPGNRFGYIGNAIGNYARSCSLSVVTDYCGHGVGLHFHEDPSVNHSCLRDTGETMRPGMVFTIEPMVNQGRSKTKVAPDGWTALTIDGRLSAQFEHTVLVTPNGVDVLTSDGNDMWSRQSA